MKLLLLSLLFINSCSFKKSGQKNQIPKGHTELYSLPHAPQKVPEGFKRVVIAATNDVAGRYESQTVFFSDDHSGKQQIEMGGEDIISSYFTNLKEVYGEFVLVDSGNIFREGYRAHEKTRKFLDTLGYDAFTLGVKDFNHKLPSLYKTSSDFIQNYSAKTDTPLLLSNLYNLQSGRLVEWKGAKPYVIKEINGVKIGIIGVIPDDFVELTPLDNRVGLFIENMLQSTLKNARLVRSLGAELVVVLTHQGMVCGEALADKLHLPISKVNFDPRNKSVCDLSGKMGAYLKRLPPKLVDVVIAGNQNKKIVNYINNTLVLTSFSGGRGLSLVEFFIDESTGKVDHEKTIPHQPLFFCKEFFKETNDCYTEDSSVDHSTRIEASFLGLPVKVKAKSKKNKIRPLRKTSKHVLPKDIESILNHQQAELAFVKQSSGEDKLMVINLAGDELMKILEEDLNRDFDKFWLPSPFREDAKNISLNIKDSPITRSRQYKVIISTNDLVEHPYLKGFFNREGTQSLHHFSWKKIDSYSDEITSGLAASEAIR
jgi:hypothetical protein